MANRVYSQSDTTQKIIAGRVNSKEQQSKPYVIMISADGFRWDYSKKYNAQNLTRLSKSGVQASSMIPSYPSVTFPNHYTLVTGLYPAHHGLVNNSFYDKKSKRSYYYKAAEAANNYWYNGTPLWVLAEQQGMLSASFYWVGSDVDVKGVLPTYYYKYNEKISVSDRIATVVKWLKLPADKRPHLITFYFSEVDHNNHDYGPDAPQTEAAVKMIDSAVNALQLAVKATGLKNVNVVFVSDHGISAIDRAHPIPSPQVDTSKFVMKGDGLIAELYAKNNGNIDSAYAAIKSQAADYDVYLKSNTPAYWHHRPADDWHHMVGDILLVPHWPKLINFNYKKISPGQHGYDPFKVKDMHATFYAWGPAFRKGLTVPAFENVHVFPIVTTILGLKAPGKIDGNNLIAKKMLVPVKRKRAK